MQLVQTFNPIPPSELESLITRSELWRLVFLHQQKEYIASLVPIDSEFLDLERDRFLAGEEIADVLAIRQWSVDDLNLHLHVPFALKKFSEFLFEPGLEDEFLSANGGHDQVVYSMLKVKDKDLVRELWIRLEEGEATFADIASSFCEGTEASRKGLVGPLPMGNIQPRELATILRSLQVGEIHPPLTYGDWHVLIRLEALQPARLDDEMRTHLLDFKLNNLLNDRVALLMRGEVPTALTYNP